MVEIGAGGSLDMAISTMQGRVRADSVEDVAFEYCLHLLKQAETRECLPFSNMIPISTNSAFYLVIFKP